MDLQFRFDFASKSNLSSACDLLNEAFIESFNEESYESCKSLSANPDSATPDVFETISIRKPFSQSYFEDQNRAKVDNSGYLPEVNEVSKRWSETDTQFSPLEDISNIKLQQPTNNEVLKSSISGNVFKSTSKFGDIRIPRNSKENCHATPKLTKIKSKKVEDLVFKENKETNQAFDKIQKSTTSTKQGVYPRKQIPVLNWKTGSKLPMLKSEESNLRNKFQSPGTANKKVANKAISGYKFFTPNSSDKCISNRRSLQHENKLREDRLLAEKKHRKSISSLLRKPKDSNLKYENKVSGKVLDGLVLPNSQISCSTFAAVQPVKKSSVEKCADIITISQNEKFNALAKEPGILEVTDLTLCSNTVYFSRIFEDTFQFPKKTEDKAEVS